MTQTDKYVRVVEWSDEDGCYIGSCPELFYGGVHGDDPREVFDQLQQAIGETIDIYRQDGKPLPHPLTARQFVDAMQRVA